jgi:hypothetical protein
VWLLQESSFFAEKKKFTRFYVVTFSTLEMWSWVAGGLSSGVLLLKGHLHGFVMMFFHSTIGQESHGNDLPPALHILDDSLIGGRRLLNSSSSSTKQRARGSKDRGRLTN